MRFSSFQLSARVATMALATLGGALALSHSALAQDDPLVAAAPQARSGWSEEEIVRRIGSHATMTTFAAVAIDVDRLRPEEFVAALKSLAELSADEESQILAGMTQAKGAFDQAGIRQVVLLLDVHPQRMLSMTAMLRIDEKADVLAASELAKQANVDGLEEVRFVDGALLLTAAENGEEGPAAAPLKDLEPLKAALAAGGDAPVRAALFLSDDLRKVIGELSFALGDKQAVDAAKLVAKELRYASLAFDPSENMEASVAIRFQSADGAAKGAEMVKQGIERLREEVSKMEELPFEPETLDQVAAWLVPEKSQDGSELVLHRSLADPATAALFRDLVSPAVMAAREQSAYMTTANKFKQIAIAFHNFYDTYRMFPLAGNQKKDGKAAGLSWRVHLLPFLEQVELYNKFKLDEPWNSPHNLALVDEMPDIYRADSSVPNGKTTVLLPMGEGYGFSGDGPTEFQQITDGTSNTIMFVQAAPSEAVTWTKPEDLDVDTSELSRQLGAEGKDIFVAARFDGSVHVLPKAVPAEVLVPFFTRAGSEVVDEAMLRTGEPAEDPAKDASNEMKLKRLGIAFHNFHDTYRMLPLAGKQRHDGKASGLSWRVYLLPFIDGGLPLYKQFKLDEPWDSEHNRALIDQMPEIYNLDPKAPKGKTVALLPMGEGYGFSGEAPGQFAQFTDGLSNTILVVQASPSEAVTWTKPADLEVDLSEFADQLGAEGEKNFLVLMFDGRVLKLDESIDDEKLEAAFTRAGGEPVQLP